ncbi:MAG TPA: hypothetical protein DCZ72_15580 [Armatimonadetes bacterium]|nr:hypothetical protein [Armatimonadota bacterium]
MTLSEALVEMRRRADLTQAELADRLGTHQVTISQRENARQSPPAEQIVQIAAATNTRLVVDANGWQLADAAAAIPDNPDRDGRYSEPGPGDGLPVVGFGGAGPPAAMLDRPESWLSVDQEFRHHVDGGIVVDGDSMAPLLQAGDVVGLRKGDGHRPGDVVAVLDLTDQDLLIKIFWGYDEEGSLMLSSYNPLYEPVSYPPGTAEVLGSIWGTWRKGAYRLRVVRSGE